MKKINKITLCAIFLALTAVMTMLSFPIPFGYIHLGDGVILLAGALLGARYGMLIGSIGASMADFVLGYPQYMIATFIIKGCLGGLAGLSKNGKTANPYYLILAGVILVVGYYITDVILYGNAIAPLSAMPLNILQYSIGFVMCKISKPYLNRLSNTQQ